MMALVWNPWALPNLSVGALTVLIALFLLHVGGGRTTNRLLAAVFLFYGFAWISLGLLYSHDDPAQVHAAQMMFNVTIVPGILLYPAFMGHALTRAPGFLRSRAWLLSSIACAVLLDGLLLFRADWAIDGITAVPFAAYDTIPGPLMAAYLLLATLVALLGLALSIIERLGTRPGTPERTRANTFLLAFGIQDLVFFTAPFVVLAAPPGSWANILANVAAGAIGSLAASLIVTYGILRHQLFDIEVHLRFAISRSTIAAIFIAVFFVASEVAQQFFGETTGSAYVGIVAAGGLVFAIAPLQRAAEHLAERAVPSGDAPQVLHSEQTYRRALRVALRDRRLARHEELHMAELAEALGIGAGRAAALLQEVERELDETH